MWYLGLLNLSEFFCYWTARGPEKTLTDRVSTAPPALTDRVPTAPSALTDRTVGPYQASVTCYEVCKVCAYALGRQHPALRGSNHNHLFFVTRCLL